LQLKEEMDLEWREELQEWAEGKGAQPFRGGVRHVHGRIEDEFWGIVGGFRLEKSKISRYLEWHCEERMHSKLHLPLQWEFGEIKDY
jgi:hypothetical protein